MKKVFLSIGRALKNNLLLKIISIFAAILIWLFVMADTNPIRTVNVDSIAVGTSGTEELHSKNLVVTAEDLTEIITVRAQVNVGQQSIDSISHSTVDANVDLSVIHAPGEYELDIETSSPLNSTVISVTPSTVIVKVEELVSRDIPIIIETTGEAQDGFYVQTPEVTPTLLTIQGAESIVETISSAICTVDLSEYTQDSIRSVNIELMDAEGNIVNADGLISDHPSAILTVPVTQTKSVSVDPATSKLAITNVAEGYEVTNVTIAPSEIPIVGDNLDDITTLAIESVNANGAKEDFTVNAQLTQIEGITYPNGRNVTISVSIAEQTTTQVFEDVAITVTDLRSGYEHELSEELVDIAVTGTLSALANIEEDDLSVTASAQGLLTGTHNVDLTVQYPIAIDGISSVVATPNGVSITLSVG